MRWNKINNAGNCGVSTGPQINKKQKNVSDGNPISGQNPHYSIFSDANAPQEPPKFTKNYLNNLMTSIPESNTEEPVLEQRKKLLTKTFEDAISSRFQDVKDGTQGEYSNDELSDDQ